MYNSENRDVEKTRVWITSEKCNDKLREFVSLMPEFYRKLQDLADKRREAYLFPILRKQPG
jgi:hypothetical protein